MRRLNLGCGNDVRPAADGWVNTDIRELPGVDVILDARDLSSLKDGEFDELLCQDLLEHIPPVDIPHTLVGWRRVLKEGGSLLLRVPNILMIARRLVSGTIDEDTAVLLLYGDQSPGAGGTDWGGHKAAYTGPQLVKLLAAYGFAVMSIRDDHHEHNLYCVAKAV